MGVWSGGDEVYGPIFSGDEDEGDPGPDWVEEPRSGVRLVAVGATAAIVLLLAFWLLAALSWPFVESVIDFWDDRWSDFGDGGA